MQGSFSSISAILFLQLAEREAVNDDEHFGQCEYRSVEPNCVVVNQFHPVKACVRSKEDQIKEEDAKHDEQYHTCLAELSVFELFE